MRILTLQEWADEKNVHYTTAKRHLDKGRIKGVIRNELNKITILMPNTKEEEYTEQYNAIYGSPVPALATIAITDPTEEKKEELLDRSMQLAKKAGIPYSHVIERLTNFDINTTEHAIQYLEQQALNSRLLVSGYKEMLDNGQLSNPNPTPTTIVPQTTPTILSPEKKGVYQKKVKPEVIPSLLAGDALIDENLQRCMELGVNYEATDKALSKIFFGMPGDMSLYLDEYQRNKTKIGIYTQNLVAKDKRDNPKAYEDDNIPTKEPTQLDTMLSLVADANKKHGLGRDYDLIKQCFENSKEPSLQGDGAITEYITNHFQIHYVDYATDIVAEIRSGINE